MAQVLMDLSPEGTAPPPDMSPVDSTLNYLQKIVHCLFVSIITLKMHCPIRKRGNTLQLVEDLKKQDTREEVAYASPSQKLEQNVPRTPWGFNSQPHEDVASSRECRLCQQGSADRVAREEFIGEFAVGLGAGPAGVVLEDGFAVAGCLADADRAWDHCAIDLLGEVV